MNKPNVVDIDLFRGRRAPFIERNGGARIDTTADCAVLLAETPGSLEPQPAPRKARAPVRLDGPYRPNTWWRRAARAVRRLINRWSND